MSYILTLYLLVSCSLFFFRDSLFKSTVLVNKSLISKWFSFKNIWLGLRNLVQFVQLKKREKHPWSSFLFSQVAGFRLNASHIIVMNFEAERFMKNTKIKNIWNMEYQVIVKKSLVIEGFLSNKDNFQSSLNSLIHFMPEAEAFWCFQGVSNRSVAWNGLILLRTASQISVWISSDVQVVKYIFFNQNFVYLNLPKWQKEHLSEKLCKISLTVGDPHSYVRVLFDLECLIDLELFVCYKFNYLHQLLLSFYSKWVI